MYDLILIFLLQYTFRKKGDLNIIDIFRDFVFEFLEDSDRNLSNLAAMGMNNQL